MEQERGWRVVVLGYCNFEWGSQGWPHEKVVLGQIPKGLGVNPADA